MLVFFPMMSRQTSSGRAPRWVWLLAFASVAPLVAQQRIFTNPKPEEHFKTVMPAAAAFSRFGGTPLHWKAYAADPATNRAAEPVGYIFWTTDLAPDEFAYHGPIHILVGLDTKGVITGAVVDYHSEPYGYFSVEPAGVRGAVQGQERLRPLRGGSGHRCHLPRVDQRQERHARGAGQRAGGGPRIPEPRTGQAARELSGLPPAVEDHRDHHWRRDVTRIVQTVIEAERFIEQVGFAASMTDSRRPGPSLYVAVCGRRDAVMPRNVQTDPEASLTWTLKDQIVRRSKVDYAKFSRGKTLFLAPRMIPFFHAVWGMRRAEEPKRLSGPAQAVLRVLRREWEMGTADLRNESGVTDRTTFSKAMDELQAAMIVVPSEVIYQPKFTYIWTLAVGRFPEGLRRRVSREAAFTEIARCFLTGAGMTIPGELARVTGLSRPEAGLGNRALVAEGFARMPSAGTYHLRCSHNGGRRLRP